MESEKILGQNHILKHFENAIKMNKISHAYIINGEKGSGKMSLALSFAKALQCEGDERSITGRSCGRCKSCKQTESRNQPDIKFVTHEKSGIGVDEIRAQLNEDIEIKPYRSKYKIYIIDESEKMTVQAQNALLKTIEEPPEYAIIILLTTNADTFLQTILSRCVLLNIRPVKEDIIKKNLMSEYGIGSYEAKIAAAFANGNPGKAVSLATSEDFKDLKQQVVGTLVSLDKGGMDIIGQKIKEAGEVKKQIEDYFNLMRIWFRDVLLYKAVEDNDRLIFQDDYHEIINMSKKLSYFDINVILKSIEHAWNRIHSNVNFDITMEVLFLSIKERIKQ